MDLEYNQFGNLVPGVHEMEWEEFKEKFGITDHRLWLIEGIELAIEDLRKVGCPAIFIDGSFVTKKAIPTDFDLCWEDEGISLKDVKKICYPLVDCGWRMSTIIERYRGEVVPKNNIIDLDKGLTVYAWYTEDRQGRDKGIIKINI
jgi:hypothetical protein